MNVATLLLPLANLIPILAGILMIEFIGDMLFTIFLAKERFTTGFQGIFGGQIIIGGITCLFSLPLMLGILSVVNTSMFQFSSPFTNMSTGNTIISNASLGSIQATSLLNYQFTLLGMGVLAAFLFVLGIQMLDRGYARRGRSFGWWLGDAIGILL